MFCPLTFFLYFTDRKSYWRTGVPTRRCKHAGLHRHGWLHQTGKKSEEQGYFIGGDDKVLAARQGALKLGKVLSTPPPTLNCWFQISSLSNLTINMLTYVYINFTYVALLNVDLLTYVRIVIFLSAGWRKAWTLHLSASWRRWKPTLGL